MNPNRGILLIDKARGTNSFRLVSILRRLTHIEKIGHAGTLDPFATGLMVLLIGKEFTQKSNQFLNCDKEYLATLRLGIATDTYDLDGAPTHNSDKIPTLAELEAAIASFQGEISQIPPMFSAKKVDGQKLCDLARKGVVIERKPVQVRIEIELLEYLYPEVKIRVACSKGTYIRSLANDLGNALGCFAHLSALARTRSGHYHLKDAIAQANLQPGVDLSPYLRWS